MTKSEYFTIIDTYYIVLVNISCIFITQIVVKYISLEKNRKYNIQNIIF